jgi:long-chain fatty acid transport protein
VSFCRDSSQGARSSLALPLASILFGIFIAAFPAAASAQTIEEVGTRAQGMGGAFVAVANDSTATWWNPAGTAAGPFVDVTGGVWRPTDGNSWGIALTTPVLGASFYRLHTPGTQSRAPTAGPGGDRQEGRVGLPASSLRIGQFGATLAHSVFSRLHAGATIKVVRGLPEADAVGDSGQTHPDVDLGGLGIVGPVRIGVVARNLASPVVLRTAGADVRLDRQVRVGAAFDGALRPVDRTVPLVVSVDADVMSYDTIRGPRRTIAAGVERWFAARRVGARAGVRFNQVGEQERTVSIGASYRLVAGVVADGFVTAGSKPERAWGLSVHAFFF